jgi:hypothetical protein
MQTEAQAFEEIFIRDSADNEVFDQVLAETVDDEFTMSDFVPKYAYTLLELNTEFKRL